MGMQMAMLAVKGADCSLLSKEFCNLTSSPNIVSKKALRHDYHNKISSRWSTWCKQMTDLQSRCKEGSSKVVGPGQGVGVYVIVSPGAKLKQGQESSEQLFPFPQPIAMASSPPKLYTEELAAAFLQWTFQWKLVCVVFPDVCKPNARVVPSFAWPRKEL